MAKKQQEECLQKLTKYKPTAAEKKLLEALLNLENKGKTIDQVCKHANVSRVTYYKALKKQGFRDLINQESKALVAETVIPVLNAFRKKAVAGSFWHGKVLLEMAGMYTEKQEIKVEASVNIAERMKKARERVANVTEK